MTDPFTPVKINTTRYARSTRLDGDLYKDLADLGWDYTAGRMSRSGMEIFDDLMQYLGALDKGEHWNEDVYADANGDW